MKNIPLPWYFVAGLFVCVLQPVFVLCRKSIQKKHEKRGSGEAKGSDGADMKQIDIATPKITPSGFPIDKKAKRLYN